MSTGFAAAAWVDFLSLCFPSMLFIKQIICKKPLKCCGDDWKTNYNFLHLRNETEPMGQSHRVERHSLCPQTFNYFFAWIKGRLDLKRKDIFI